jgi:hypothetical protein
MHVRINLLVRKPDAGCAPLLDGHVSLVSGAREGFAQPSDAAARVPS